MRHDRIVRQVLFGVSFPLAVLLVPTLADADDVASSGKKPAAVSVEQVSDTKPNRLRFRSSNGACACTCAKGGLREADLKQAEEARTQRGN